MTVENFGWDVFLRHTNPDGSSYVDVHRAWDTQRFLEARKRDAIRVNEQQKADEPRKAAVHQITEQQYHQERKPRT